MAYIEFKNVDKIYKMGEVEIKALKDTTFEIEKGELVCILGPSGAGKSTLLNYLSKHFRRDGHTNKWKGYCWWS